MKKYILLLLSMLLVGCGEPPTKEQVKALSQHCIEQGMVPTYEKSNLFKPNTVYSVSCNTVNNQ